MKRDPLAAFLRDLERLYQVHRMYPVGHGQIAGAAAQAVRSLRAWGRPVRVSLLGEDLVVEDQALPRAGGKASLLATLLKTNGWEGLRIAPTCSTAALLDWVTSARGGSGGSFAGGDIVAGRLDLRSSPIRGEEEAEADAWQGGYPAYLPDANQALAELGAASPEGLDRARQLVHSISRRMVADESLLGAVRALKSFDEYTYTHALNVSVLAMALGRWLGLPGDLCEVLGLAGLCHDVGKTHIPVEILNKPGRLSDGERAVMNGHPTMGARILLALPVQPHPLLPVIAYQHHVGNDLGGYPQLSNGQRPHPLALLMQVADIFDALRTVRPYRGTLSEIEAVNILLRDRADGRVHDVSVCALVGVLGLLTTGARVRLVDGVEATVVGEAEPHRLAALLETDAGDILDLSDPGLPQVAGFVEREGREGRE